MKLTQIDNACCIYESQGFKLLCDPWLTDGAFEGSWYHYPPLSTRVSDISNSDALYISHLHPDHYDVNTLRSLRKDIPVIILDKEPNYLKRKLATEIGFTNIIMVESKKSVTIGPMEVTAYEPFTTHPFDNSVLGNFIDSAIVVESNGKVILNANDNTPTKEAAEMLYERHGRFTLVQLKDALASPYPSCFTNLSHEEKLSEVTRLINRQLSAMCEVAVTLKAEWFQPFAGDYQLGGRLVEKNQYLGVPGKKYSAEFIAQYGIKPLILNEQGSFDFVTSELKSSYRPNLLSYKKWMETVSKVQFDYEKDPEVRMEDLQEKLNAAQQRLLRFQEKHNYFPNDTVVSINGFEMYLGKYPVTSLHHLKRVDFTMDNRLLARILDRKAHWNNASVGCHIEINRVPNIYDPDLETALCFFHT